MYIKTSVKNLLWEQFLDGSFNRYDILVRFDAICKSQAKEEHAFDLYCKMDSIRVPCSPRELNGRVTEFVRIINSFSVNGYSLDNPVLVNKQMHLLDGSHRAACALYFNTPLTLVAASTPNTPTYGRDWFAESGFTEGELGYLDKLALRVLGTPQHIEQELKRRESIRQELCDIYKASGTNFGRGKFYQQFDLLKLEGQRPIVERFDQYKICDKFPEHINVLDIGSNTGFMSLYIAPRVAHVDGIEMTPSFVTIANKAAELLDIKNCTFHNTRFEDFAALRQYNVILSFAVHYYMKFTFTEYFQKVDSMLGTGGYFVLESGDLEAEDKDFDQKIEFMKSLNYEVYSSGSIKDDGIIFRRFVVMHKLPPPVVV